ncbi:MAG: DNA mismatch repair protein [Phylliscum demangeonii]|nr:MAG: DNA mismatch repair protein [Phylliscum demangeonii]
MEPESRRKLHRLLEEHNGESNREWEALKKGIVALLLGWGCEVDLLVSDAQHVKKFAFQRSPQAKILEIGAGRRPVTPLALTKKLVVQASYQSRQHADFWVSLSGSNASLSISGAICLKPAPTKQVQFLSLGVEPIIAETGHNILVDEINRFFAASTFGIVEDVDGLGACRRKRSLDGYGANRPGTGMKKGVEKWPMFFMKIEIGPSKLKLKVDEDDILGNQSNLNETLNLLRVMVGQFLKEYCFEPKHTPVIRDPTTRTNQSINGQLRIADIEIE